MQTEEDLELDKSLTGPGAGAARTGPRRGHVHRGARPPIGVVPGDGSGRAAVPRRAVTGHFAPAVVRSSAGLV
jgi:hypothetical protein